MQHSSRVSPVSLKRQLVSICWSAFHSVLPMANLTLNCRTSASEEVVQASISPIPSLGRVLAPEAASVRSQNFG